MGWLFYAALASVMLLAMTNHVCQDVAPVPFLWVLPLALYLVSLIICFEKERWYSPRWCGPATAVAIAIVSLLMAVNRMPYLWAEVTIYMGTLLLICILCHGQLVRRKPAPQFLTSFYLMTSAGGALGGIAVALIAPHIFSSYLELNFGLAICYLLALAAAFEGVQLRTSFGTRRWVAAASVAAFLGLLFVVRTQAAAMAVNMLAVTRDFYGVIAVDEFDRDNPVEHRRFMRHGRIMHGLQYLNPEREMKPTLYFTESSGIGRTIRTLEAEKPNLRVGIIGLGIGTLAAYGRTGDDYRYYEIDPEVLRLAKEFFTYMDKSTAHVECILGDARLSLERERPQKFDLLVVDAFSGDAIPAHLLTREALETYLRHLNQDGVLAIHISNRNVDLAPVVKGLAEGANLESRLVVTTDDEFKTSVSTAYWTLMSRNDKVLGSPLLREVAEPLSGRTLFWTDDFSNVFEILK